MISKVHVGENAYGNACGIGARNEGVMHGLERMGECACGLMNEWWCNDEV